MNAKRATGCVTMARMMTNFERWKQALTPQDIFTNFGVFSFCGKNCPAKDYCKPSSARIPFDGRKCNENFFEWANKEADA